jgi:hypothetical protein
MALKKTLSVMLVVKLITGNQILVQTKNVVGNRRKKKRNERKDKMNLLKRLTSSCKKKPTKEQS